MSDTADSILPGTGTPVIEHDLSFLTMSDTTGVPRSPSGLRGTLAQGGRRRSAPTTPRRTPAADRFIPSSANVQAFRMGSPAHKLTPEEKHRRGSSARNQHGRTDSPERIAVYNPGSGRTIGLAGGSGSPGGTYANQRTISGGGVGVFSMGTGGVSNARVRAAEQPRMSSGAREINGNIFAKKEGMEAAKRRLENMLSAALEVDRSKKVFEFKNKASELGKGSGAMWDDPFLSPSRSSSACALS